MKQLAKSKRALWLKCAHVPSIFKRLGIPFKQIEGKSFWEANKQQLPELYREFQSEARDKMRALHPDKGGDGHAFGLFVDSVARVRKSFAWHLQELTPILTDEAERAKKKRRANTIRATKWNRANPEKRAAHVAKYDKLHPEVKKAATRRYQATPKGKAALKRAYEKRRAANLQARNSAL